MNTSNQQMRMSSQQLFFMLNGAILGSSVFYDSSALAQIMNQNGWMAILIGGLIMILDVLLITTLASRYPKMQIAEYSDLILGKFAGKLPVILFVVFTSAIVAAEVDLVTNITTTFLLPQTPPLVVKIIAAIMIIYAITGGITSLARINQVLFWALIPALMLFIPVISYVDTTNLFPVGHISVSSIINGTLHMNYSLVGAELLLVWYPQIAPPSQINKVSIITYLSIIFIDCYLFMLVILVMSPKFAASQVWAPLGLLKLIDLPAIGRIDFYGFLLWIAIAFRPLANYMYSSVAAVQFWAKPISYNLCAIVMTGLVIALSCIPGNINQTLQYSEYVGWLGLVTAFFIPALLLIVDIVRHGRRYCYEK